MIGRGRRLFIAAAAVAFCADAAALEQTADWLIEGQVTRSDAETSWTERGLGKLRGSGDDTDGAVRLALDYGLQITETLSAHLALDGYAGTDTDGGVTEAWVAWEPVPTSSWAYSVRAGSVIPPFSMEHVDTGWTSPYMPTGSMLNSWVGEELRTHALEFTVQRRGSLARSPHTLTLKAAAFRGNDTSGTLLSWRGWAANDRVTPLGNDLPLPERPALQPGGPFPGAQRTDPFLEIDDEPGFYASGTWRYRHELQAMLGYYDNRADPLALREGQAGWRTRFGVAGARWQPAEAFRVIAQYLEGDTLVGQRGSARSAFNDFRAWFLLAARDWRDHRFAARIEGFEVEDLDRTPLDDNREDGHGWALSWQYEWHRDATLGVEFLRLDYDRPGRSLLGLDPSVNEDRVRVNLRYRF